MNQSLGWASPASPFLNWSKRTQRGLPLLFGLDFLATSCNQFRQQLEITRILKLVDESPPEIKRGNEQDIINLSFFVASRNLEFPSQPVSNCQRKTPHICCVFVSHPWIQWTPLVSGLSTNHRTPPIDSRDIDPTRDEAFHLFRGTPKIDG